MTDDTPRTELEAQIAQEKAELEAVPKIPIGQFMGIAQRCHICGGVVPVGDLQPFDTHKADNGAGPNPRLACPSCHPARGQQ